MKTIAQRYRSRYRVTQVTRDGNVWPACSHQTLIGAQECCEQLFQRFGGTVYVTDMENPERGDLSTADPILEEEREEISR